MAATNDEFDTWEDYEGEIGRAVERLETDDHEMFTLVTGGGDGQIEASVLSALDGDHVASAEQAGVRRLSMVHTMFDMVIDATEISRYELAMLLISGEFDRTVTDERRE